MEIYKWQINKVANRPRDKNLAKKTLKKCFLNFLLAWPVVMEPNQQ